MKRVVVFPLAQAKICGWPDKVELTEKQAKALCAIDHGTFLQARKVKKPILFKLEKIGLIFLGVQGTFVTDFGKCVAKALKAEGVTNQ